MIVWYPHDCSAPTKLKIENCHHEEVVEEVDPPVSAAAAVVVVVKFSKNE